MKKEDLITIGEGERAKQFKNVSYESFYVNCSIISFSQKEARKVFKRTLEKTLCSPKTLVVTNKKGIETVTQNFVKDETIHCFCESTETVSNANSVKSYRCGCELISFYYERV